MTIGGSSDSVPENQSTGLPSDVGLSVSQKQGEGTTGETKKVGQATRVGDLESGTDGKTFASYSVKMTMPNGTSKSYKIRVGFNESQLRQHVQDSGGEEAELANVIDRIVDSMDAASIAKLSGHQISSRLNEWDKATVTMKGGEQKTIGDLQNDSNPELQSLGSSASKVINAFNSSAIGQALRSSAPPTTSRTSLPSSRDGPSNPDRLTRSASQSNMTTKSTEQGRQRSSSEPDGEPPTVTKEANTPKNTDTPKRPLTSPPQHPLTTPEPRSRSVSDPIAQSQTSPESKGKDDLGRVNPRTSEIGGDVEDLDSPVIHLAVTEEATPRDSPLLTSSNQSPTSSRRRSLEELKKAAISGSSDMEASAKAAMQLIQDENVLCQFDSAISSNQKEEATKTKIPSENYVEVVDAIMNLESHNVTEQWCQLKH